MTDVTQGNTASFTLAAGEQVYIKTAGAAVVKYGRLLPKSPSVVQLTSADSEVRYGPYPVEMLFEVSATTGTLTYSDSATVIQRLPDDGSDLSAKFNAVADALGSGTGGMTPAEIGGAIEYSKLPYGFLGVDSVVAIEGDSIMAIGGAGAQADWAVCSFSNGCGSRPENFNVGTGGETAEQMTSQIDTVLANSPELVYFGAGTNDIKNGRTADQIKSDISTCVFGYLNGGAKYVYVFKVLPRVYGNNEFDADSLEVMRQVNDHIESIASKSNRIICEGDVSWFSDIHTDDGTHPNWFGAYERARRNIRNLRSFWNSNSVIFKPYGAENLLKSLNLNPELTGSGGGSNALSGTITGTVPDSWFAAQDADVDTVISLEPDFFGVGLNGVRITISGTGLGAPNKLVKIRANPNPTINGQIGDAYEAWCQYHIDSGHYGISNIQIDFDTLDTINSDRATAITGGQEMSGVMRSYTTAPLSASKTSSEFAMKIEVRGPTPTGGDVYCSVVFGTPYLRQIT